MFHLVLQILQPRKKFKKCLTRNTKQNLGECNLREDGFETKDIFLPHVPSLPGM